MRTKRRVAFTLATAAAFAVGFIAFAASAAADPPACNPGTSPTDNKSCVNFQVLPSNRMRRRAGEPVRAHAHELRPSGQQGPGRVREDGDAVLDNDFAITPGTIPKCTTAQLSGKNISQAWATCGPGAGAAHNAYLSPATAVSGKTSTAPPSNFPGCTLVFNGPTTGGNPTVILYARVTLGPTANCAAPASNTSGNTTVLLTGTIAPAGVAGFGKKLTVPGIDALPLPLDDFTALVKRGSYFKAKCTPSPWKVRGTFAYSGTGQAADTSNATQACS